MPAEFWEPENDISITSKKLISNKVLTKTLLTLKITTILTLHSFDGIRNDSAPKNEVSFIRQRKLFRCPMKLLSMDDEANILTEGILSPLTFPFIALKIQKQTKLLFAELLLCMSSRGYSLRGRYPCIH